MENTNTGKKPAQRACKVFSVQGARQCKKDKRAHNDYQVEVAVRGKIVKATTDTGAEINVMPRRTAKKLKLPIEVPLANQSIWSKTTPCSWQIRRLHSLWGYGDNSNMVYGTQKKYRAFDKWPNSREAWNNQIQCRSISQ